VHCRRHKMYAEECLKAELRQEMQEESLRPSQRKEMVQWSAEKHHVSIQLACLVYGLRATSDYVNVHPAWQANSEYDYRTI